MTISKPSPKVRGSRVYTVGLRKPSLGARVLHLAINNRAWLKDVMSKPIKCGSKKNG